MIFTTMTQYVVLALVFVVGLAAGGLLVPRGTKWRRRYEAERDAHATYRHDAEARLRERATLDPNRDAYVRDLEASKERLERENAALKTRLPPGA